MIRVLGRTIATCGSLALAACSAPPAGQITAAVTIDWEGAFVSPDALDALDELRARHPELRLTHFMSAGYFTKHIDDAEAVDVASLRAAVRPTDELAVHLHGWTSLARAAGVDPRTSPSFLTGTEALLPFEDGDAGLDLDLDAYPAAELRALLRRSRELLAPIGSVSTAFRAGGYLGTPRVLQAIRDEGFTIDSSAVDHRQLAESEAVLGPFAERVAEVWPAVGAASQPFEITVRGGTLVEVPIAIVVDHAANDDLTRVLDAAAGALAKSPDRDVFVVLAFHHETAPDHAKRIAEMVELLRSREARFVTISEIGVRAQGRQ